MKLGRRREETRWRVGRDQAHPGCGLSRSENLKGRSLVTWLMMGVEWDVTAGVWVEKVKSFESWFWGGRLGRGWYVRGIPFRNFLGGEFGRMTRGNRLSLYPKYNDAHYRYLMVLRLHVSPISSDNRCYWCWLITFKVNLMHASCQGLPMRLGLWLADQLSSDREDHWIWVIFVKMDERKIRKGRELSALDWISKNHPTNFGLGLLWYLFLIPEVRLWRSNIVSCSQEASEVTPNEEKNAEGAIWKSVVASISECFWHLWVMGLFATFFLSSRRSLEPKAWATLIFSTNANSTHNHFSLDFEDLEPFKESVFGRAARIFSSGSWQRRDAAAYLAVDLTTVEMNVNNSRAITSPLVTLKFKS